jgi:hypothetical protein
MTGLEKQFLEVGTGYRVYEQSVQWGCSRYEMSQACLVFRDRASDLEDLQVLLRLSYRGCSNNEACSTHEREDKRILHFNRKT